MIILVLFSLFLATQGRFLNLPQETNCGYDSCHPVKEGVVNVHIVAHTHDDVGWLKTVDQYYYGSNTGIQRAGVQFILDSVVQELKNDPTKKFIYVETAFFWKWWLEQDDQTRDEVKNLVNNGQLEFIGGAWSMNDEAASNYHSTVDQFTWGLRKLNDTFGECGRPKIGWQIDPFGHSKDMALIFAQLGFDGLFFARLDYQDKDNRWSNREPELVWQSSASLGQSADIFTGILYNGYGSPQGYCFDAFCNDEPIIDNPNIPDYNVERRLQGFFNIIDGMTRVYTTSNVLVTMGGDFNYQSAHHFYKNLDKLIKYGNEERNGTNYYIHYSTPSCYLKAVHDEAPDREWPKKADDFFPYASDEHSYWTGYFTSRPTSKRFEREANNLLQVAKQLSVISDLDVGTSLDSLREAVGIMQHHDAISGTEKQHVADDYSRILHLGIQESEQVASNALNKLLNNSEQVPFQSCLLANISSCSISQDSDSFLVTVYNPLTWSVSRVVNLPVAGQNYSVTVVGGDQVEVQLTPIPEPVLGTPGRESEATVGLAFVAADIPALGHKSFLVSKTEGNMVLSVSNTTALSFENVEVQLDDLGLLSQVTINNVSVHITHNFASYRGFVGNNSNPDFRSSGAYIFRPTEDPRALYEPSIVNVYDGPVVKEIHQTFNDFTSQVIRINNFDQLVEFQWLVGPLPSGDNGIEVISVFQSDLANEGHFFTDSNGRQILDRIRNERPTWTVDLNEPVAGNYYPITSRIGIIDEEQNIRVAVLNDRAQGGSSLNDGEVELMVHRRCNHDDDFGVGEALVETAFEVGLVARGSHYLVIGPAHGNISGSSLGTADLERLYAQEKLLQPWVFLSTTDQEITEFSGVNAALPPNVQILTLEPWKDGSILLRLEHLIEADSYSGLGVPVDVDLTDLFKSFNILSLNETTLGANQWLEENNRLIFKSNSMDVGEIRKPPKVAADLVVTLEPMQIRTFVVEVERT